MFSGKCKKKSLQLLGIDSSIVKALSQVDIKTIEDLANVDLNGNQASQLQQDISFTDNLKLLQSKAKTRRRTLPGGDLDPNTYEVSEIKDYLVNSQLPEHTINGERLIRIYLSVEYDYVENRIGALSAHVTKSLGKLDPQFKQSHDGKWQPDPNLKEYLEEYNENNQVIYQEKDIEGKNVIKFKRAPWTGDYKVDNGSEKQIIEEFLSELVEAIATVAETKQAPIHFYVWSRQEITQLIEGCSRVSSQLLSHLRELFGCRESLEQLIYSCLSDEVDQRYVLGWTGRDLAVVTSLKWFGRRYHWERKINGEVVKLDKIFALDIFDFKTNLEIDSHNQWTTKSSENTRKHQFEIRLRYFNSLSAAYWRGLWRTLPKSNDPKTAKAIESYNQAQKPNYLSEYFTARTHAIRWIEEGIKYKNSEIIKQSLVIEDLPDFHLGVDNTAQAAIDFLRLDQHVKLTSWITDHLQPPICRVYSGKTIPVKNVYCHGKNKLIAEINYENYNIKPDILRANCSIAVGSPIRLTPSFEDNYRGSTIKQLFSAGSTGFIDKIDWENNCIYFSVIHGESGRYQLYSQSYQEEKLIFDYATIDESPSDFIAGRVDHKLSSSQGNHVCQWLNPEHPSIRAQNSLSNEQLKLYKQFLETIPFASNKQLDKKQIQAILDGLTTRIQILQGPPGTGKTETTAIATFLRILARCSVGDIVLITAHTHTAVDNLLLRLDKLLPILQEHATRDEIATPEIQLAKVHSNDIKITGGNITDLKATSCFDKINNDLRGKKTVKKVIEYNKLAVIGGTTGAILKVLNQLKKAKTFDNLYPQGFQTTILIVDEASMMVFPHFLALATLVKENGEIMLAGDHRQLSPIVAHDWENEERPPILLYQPYVSAYQAINNLKENTEFTINDHQIMRSTLDNTFRLPYEIRKLIEPVYHKDNIQLTGKNKNEIKAASQIQKD